MSTKIQICNQALNLIGEQSITSLEEHNVMALRCKTLYDQTRKFLLRLHPFICATRRIQLTPLSEAPIFGWQYQFQLPDDLIRIINANQAEYAIEGSKILSNSNLLQLVYVFDNTNEETFDTLFEECLIYTLASKLAKATTGSQATADSLYMQAQDLMSMAKTVQSLEHPYQIFMAEDDFTLTRR